MLWVWIFINNDNNKYYINNINKNYRLFFGYKIDKFKYISFVIVGVYGSGWLVMKEFGRRNIIKVFLCNVMDVEYKGYCGIGYKILFFFEFKSNCIIMWICCIFYVVRLMKW